MSIINSFDISTKAILEPNCLAKPIEKFPEIVIITFKSQIIDELIKNYDVIKIDELSGGFTVKILLCIRHLLVVPVQLDYLKKLL